MNDYTRQRLERYFASSNFKRYGITPAEYKLIWVAQRGCCFICHRPFKTRLPAIDHNHFTGEVRGLLCTGSQDPKTCNRMIGFHKDNPAVFERAAEYLRNPPARPVLAQARLEYDAMHGDGVGPDGFPAPEGEHS